MPLASQPTLPIPGFVPSKGLLLTYGEPKTSKSRWYFESAPKYGNVIYIDCDNCREHLKLVPPEYAHRFAYVPAYKNPQQTLALLSQLCMKPHKAAWDEAEQQLVNMSSTMGNQDREVALINVGEADGSTLLVIDGWPVVCQAVYEHHGTEVATKSGSGDALYDMKADRGDYTPMYGQLQGMLNRFKTFGCAVAVITWEEEHTEYDPRTVGSGKSARDAVITRVTSQPVSIAHRHGRIFAGYFTQVLRFKTTPMGAKIVAKTEAGTLAGGSLLAPDEWAYAQFPYSKYAELTGQTPEIIQPIESVIGYMTLGEARVKPKTTSSGVEGTAVKAATVLKPATT